MRGGETPIVVHLLMFLSLSLTFFLSFSLHLFIFFSLIAISQKIYEGMNFKQTQHNNKPISRSIKNKRMQVKIYLPKFTLVRAKGLSFSLAKRLMRSLILSFGLVSFRIYALIVLSLLLYIELLFAGFSVSGKGKWWRIGDERESLEGPAADRGRIGWLRSGGGLAVVFAAWW